MSRLVLNPNTVFNTLQYGFSQAVLVQGGRRILLSGQVGVDARQNTVGKDLGIQTTVALDNVEAILAEAGGDLSHVVMMRIYIVESERDNQSKIGKALLERFPENPPATSWIFVSGLSEPDWMIEIEAEALLPAVIESDV